MILLKFIHVDVLRNLSLYNLSCLVQLVMPAKAGIHLAGERPSYPLFKPGASFLNLI